MGKKEQFSAVIGLSAKMESSVKSVFDGAKSEADKLGRAVNSLYEKQKRTVALDRMSGSAQGTKARLQRLYSAREVAKAEAARSSAGKIEIANLKKLNAEIAKTEKTLNKERIAILEESAALKRNGIDTKNLTQERKRLGEEIAKTERKMQRAEGWDTYGKRAVATAVIVAGAAASIIGSVFAIAKSRASAAKELLSLSGGLGMSPEYLQTFHEIGKRAGVAAGVVDGIMTKLGKSIDKAQTGKGDQFKALRELRINVAGLQKLRPEKQLEVLSQALDAYKGKNKGAVFGHLVGRAGPDVLRFMDALKMGVSGIEELKKKGLESGLFESKKDLEHSKDLATQLEDFEERWKSIGNQISNATTSAFSKFFGIVNDFFDKHEKDIAKFISDTGTALDKWVDSGEARKSTKQFGLEIWSIAKNLAWIVESVYKLGGVKGVAAAVAGPVVGVSAAKAVGGALLYRRLGKLTKTAKDVAPEVAPAANVAKSLLPVLGAVVARASIFTIPFFISGDSRRPDTSKYKPLSDSARLTSSKAELAKAQAELDEQKRSRKDMYSPERGGLVGGWMHEKWYASYIEYLEGKVKSLKESVAYNSPSLVPNSPLRRQPAGATVNNPSFVFNITAPPGGDAESIGGDIFNNLKSTYPALFDGMLHD